MTTQKSTFITVLAWIFIVLSAFGVLMSIAQNILINTFLDEPYHISKVDDASGFNWKEALFSNIKWVFAFVGLCILSFFISSIGLLKRKNWARKAIIILLVLGLMYIIGASIANVIAFRNLRSIPNQSDMEAFEIVLPIVMAVFAIGMTILYIWIIKKLMSQNIKAEFIQSIPKNN